MTKRRRNCKKTENRKKIVRFCNVIPIGVEGFELTEKNNKVRHNGIPVGTIKEIIQTKSGFDIIAELNHDIF